MPIICVEGSLGVGKTTLVQRVAQRLSWTPFYEEVEANPFLLDFYRDPERYALHVQYTFLLLQARTFHAACSHTCPDSVEHGDAEQRPIASATTAICDFHPCKSRIFASVVLQPEERGPLLQLAHLLQLPQPDLMIYLRADEHTILARLRKRNDVYRSAIDFAYIARICRAYDTFFRAYRGPCVTIDTTHIDYVSNPHELSVLLQQVPLLFQEHAFGTDATTVPSNETHEVDG